MLPQPLQKRKSGQTYALSSKLTFSAHKKVYLFFSFQKLGGKFSIIILSKEKRITAINAEIDAALRLTWSNEHHMHS